MKREAIHGSAIGLLFAGLSYFLIDYLGAGWESLALLLYLYVATGAITYVIARKELSSSLPGVLERVVIVAEGEELRMKKLFSGEKYRLKGELEKL